MAMPSLDASIIHLASLLFIAHTSSKKSIASFCLLLLLICLSLDLGKRMIMEVYWKANGVFYRLCLVTLTMGLLKRDVKSKIWSYEKKKRVDISS